MMIKQLFATDGEIYLYSLTEDDRNNYEKLRRQLTVSQIFYDDKGLSDIMWDTVINGEDHVFPIHDKVGDFCGVITLQNPHDNTPEIGIDLLECCRNKGIAQKAVKLFMNVDYPSRKNEYYLVRISSTNSHSKHLFEKMGAILLGKEEPLHEQIMSHVNQIMNEENAGEIKDKIRSLLYKEGEQEEECIYRYKLCPPICN